MSLTYSIIDRIDERLRPVIDAIKDRQSVNRALSEGALPVFEAKFRELGASNHNPYGVRSSFWNRMLATLRAGADTTQGFVAMGREVALRYFGGTVVAQVKKLLAIPARAEAYGKSPRQFNDLRFVPLSGGRGMLVQRDQTVINRKGLKNKKDKSRVALNAQSVGGGVFYWLVPQALIKADANVLPTQQQIGDGALRGLTDYLNARAARARS